MDAERFRKLADELAERDPALSARLANARDAAYALRDSACAAIEAFRKRAAERGASHLGNISISPVEPDEKHIDAVQFRIARGRLEVICVAIARGDGKMRVVGPFKRGKEEGPCAEAPLRGGEVDRLLEERLTALVREASAV